MDPNATLEALRAALRDFRDAERYADQLEASEAMADAAEALDEWITRGGFLPTAWSR